MLQRKCVAEWFVRKTKVLKKQFAGIAINCYLQGCSFSEPRWIFAFQRTCNPCCRILDLSAAVKRIWMGRIFQFYGLSWRSASAHHILQNVRHKHWICQTSPKGNPSFLIITFQKRYFHPQQSPNPPTQSNSQASVHRQRNNGNQVSKKETNNGNQGLKRK